MAWPSRVMCQPHENTGTRSCIAFWCRVSAATRGTHYEDGTTPLGWIYEAVRAGTLPCLRIGRHIRFTRAMLEEWLQGRVVTE
jgi:excisionase family DNA binding protein